MKKTIGITLLAAASFFGALAAYTFGRRRTGSSFREVYQDNVPDPEGGEG